MQCTLSPPVKPENGVVISFDTCGCQSGFTAEHYLSSSNSEQMSSTGPSFIANSWLLGQGVAHCLISYHQLHKTDAFHLRDSLVNAGIKVHVHSAKHDALLPGDNKQDDENVDLVSKSLLVVILFSEAYKRSEYCKTEALRAVMLNKPFILARMNATCAVDGWLSLAMGAEASKCPIIDMTQSDAHGHVIAAVKAKIEKIFEPSDNSSESKPRTPTSMEQEVKAKAKDLWMATQIGDVGKVRKLLESIPEGHYRDALLEVHGDERWFVDTPFLRAARCGREEVVELLIKMGAKITVKNRLGNNALHLAAGYGHVAVLKLLLDHGGIDLEEKGQWGRTPLHHAAAENHAESVRLLLAKGANIEARGGHFERTPLGFAAHFGRTEIVNILAEAGANVSAKDVDGESALHMAATTGKVDTGRFLVIRWKAQVEAIDFDNWTPLMTAAAEGQHDFVGMLLKDFQANFNATSIPEGHTALHIASEFGHRKVIETLLNHVSNVQSILGDDNPLETYLNSKNKRGDTPLLVACAHAALPAVEVLVERGADVNERNNDNATCLSLSRDVASGSVATDVLHATEEIIRLLRAKGAPEL